MKKGKLFSTITILGFMAVGAYLTSQNYSAGLSEAIAASDDALLTATCNPAAAITATTPDLNYVTTASNYVRTGAQTFSTIAVTYNGATDVNNEPAPSAITGTYFSSGGQSGNLLGTHAAAKSKIGGLFCNATTDKAKLEMKAKVNNASAVLQVAVQKSADPDNIWKSANRLDNNTTYQPLFIDGGTSILDATAVAVTDAGDFSGLLNGEIEFGGTDLLKGGYETQILMDVTNISGAASSEEFTQLFTNL